MPAKIDSSSSVEPLHEHSAVSSAASTSSPKISMFGAKSGFVIPKNKLSGSLVPIFRGGSKIDTGSTVKEESSKQVQRKTKWGADLTQDAVVRKGRALAYQTRVEQITQQLKSGALEIGVDQSSWSPKQTQQSTTDRADQNAKNLELLEFEKRELIGEILRLNPSCKAPPDYKPLLKECKVPIPVKAYPGYNFIGLLLGPESNTQKRLEEETGAKIQVYGTKQSTKEKREITQSDISEAQGDYDEIYVNVSADTYEKVDAAVSLIELLITPVAGNASVASKNSSSVTEDNVVTSTADTNQVTPKPTLVSAPSDPLQYQQQQYSGPWFPRPATGFAPHPMLNLARFPSYFQANRPQLPPQAMHQPPRNQFIPPQNQAMSGQQPPLAYRPAFGSPIPLTRPASSSGWSSAPFPQRPNMAQMVPQPFNPPVRPQQGPNNVIRTPPVNFSPASFPSQPTVQASFTPVPSFPSVSAVPAITPQPQPATSLTGSGPIVAPPVPFPSVSPVSVPGPKLIRPSAGDFTFQPLKAQVPELPATPRPNNSSSVPLAAPQAPSFRPASQSLPSSNQQRPMHPMTFAANSTRPLIIPTPAPMTYPAASPRFPFPSTNTPLQHISPIRSMALATQMGPPSFSPAALASARPAHPPNFLQLHQNQLPSNRPSGFMNNQIYDPFSPTSISSAASHQGGEHEQLKVRKQETDAEYEDLMASVGVK